MSGVSDVSPLDNEEPEERLWKMYPRVRDKLLLAERAALLSRVRQLEDALRDWIAPGTVYEIRRNGQILDLHARARALLAGSVPEEDTE